MFKQLWTQSPMATFHQFGWQMSFAAWVILGLVAGFIASKIVNRHGEGFVIDILLGVVGAFVGGLLFNWFGATGVTGFNLWSLLVATTGAAALLFLYHAIRGRRWADS